MTTSHNNSDSISHKDSNSEVGRWLYWDEPVIVPNKEQPSNMQDVNVKHDETLLEQLYLEYVMEFNNLDLKDRSPENSERIFKNKVRYYATQRSNI